MYLEPLTCDLFITRFAYYHFDGIIFSTLGSEKLHPEKQGKIYWYETIISHFDLHNN